MPATPKKDRRAQTGSNLRGNPLHTHRANLWAKRNAPFKRLAREYQRQVRALFSKADLRMAADLAATVQAECRRAALQVGGEASKIASLKDAARQKLDRLLARTLPNYRKLRALRQTCLREHHRLHTLYHAGLPHDQVHVDFGDVAPPDPADGKIFTSPFPLFAVSRIDEGGIVAEDESFVLPASSHWLHKTVCHDAQDTPAILGTFGLLERNHASSLVACGVSYSLPRSGRLKVSAVLRNFWNQASYSLNDTFGFSWGKLIVEARLFVDIVRGNDVIHLPTTLVSDPLRSDGGNISRVLPDLDTSAPYTVEALTDETFSTGDAVRILAGSEVYVYSELDDMESHVNAIFWWQLQKMAVEVVN